MAFWVYILKCYINGEFRCFYVGQTGNITERMEYHYDAVRYHNIDKYTGRFDFVKLVWKKRVQTREDALRLERYLKSLSPNGKKEYMEDN